MPVMPSDSPAAPAQYDAVAVQPLNIQAPQDSLSGATREAVSVASGPRQAQSQTLMELPQGFGTSGFDVDAGYPGSWGTNVEPTVAGP